MSGQVKLQNTIDTQHEDMIHDAQLDYYGRKLATCSSDKTIKVFEIANNARTLIDTLVGHEGPVWQVAWAHPKFGSILASCSYDRKVIIWKEGTSGWVKLYEFGEHKSSVNCVQWAPHDWGLQLACVSSDESFSILSNSGDGPWKYTKHENAHALGCNAVSWAPAVNPSSLVEANTRHPVSNVKRIVTGGGDNLVKIWREENDNWILEDKLEAHTDWVRDVAWAPSVGLPLSRIASCSQDGKVIVWTKDESSGQNWTPKVLKTFAEVVWRASWSVTGDILAVSGGDNKVTLWKEQKDGEWACVQHSELGAFTGAPIGDLIFSAKFISNLRSKIRDLLSRLQQIGPKDPQVAYLLLCFCGSFCKLSGIALGENHHLEQSSDDFNNHTIGESEALGSQSCPHPSSTYTWNRLNSRWFLNDPLGHHTLTCKSGGDLIVRHVQCTARHFLESCKQACIGGQLEAGSSLEDEGRQTRPADILVQNWEFGKPAALDFTVTSPATLNGASVMAGSAASAAEARKHLTNDAKCNRLGWVCISLAVVTYGCNVGGDEAIKYLDRLAARIATRTARPKSSAESALYGRLSIVLVRANARAIGLQFIDAFCTIA
eukprot:Em0001g1706a